MYGHLVKTIQIVITPLPMGESRSVIIIGGGLGGLAVAIGSMVSGKGSAAWGRRTRDGTEFGAGRVPGL